MRVDQKENLPIHHVMREKATDTFHGVVFKSCTTLYQPWK